MRKHRQEGEQGQIPGQGLTRGGVSELGESDALQVLLLHCSLDRLNNVLGLQHAHIPGRLDKKRSI